MKKIILGLLLLSLFSLNSCKSDPYSDLQVYSGKNFDAKSFFNFLGPTFEIIPLEVEEFIKYRDGILKNKNLISNYKDPVGMMTVGELDKLADSSSKREEVIFIFGLDSTKKLRFGIISSLGYPFDNNLKVYYGKGSWLKNTQDSSAYVTYRDGMIKSKMEPYSNFIGYPFVSFSKNSLKKVINDFKTKPELKKKWSDTTKLYFHYGYSKDINGKYHAAILFTPLDDLSKAGSTDLGFANRGGTCCPPQN